MSDQPRTPAVRIGDAERDATEARLHRAVSQGALTLDEFSDRMTLVLAAKTQSELDEVLADLPAAPPPPAARGPVRRWLVAIMSGEETRGRWRPAPTTNAVAVMGGVEVDLRDAEVDPEGFTLNATAVMGGVEVVVPDGMGVEVGGFAFMGGRDVRVEQPVDPDAPVVRVNAYALMGGVEIRNPTRKEIETAHQRASAGPQEPADRYRDLAVARQEAAQDRALRRYEDRTQHAVARRDRPGGSWFGRVVVAAVIATLTSPIWLPGPSAVAVFGSRDETITPAEAAADPTVNTAAVFGGTQVVVPDGTIVDDRGFGLFGSFDCDACGEETSREAPTVTVRGYALFGSVNIRTVSQAADEELEDRLEDAND